MEGGHEAGEARQAALVALGGALRAEGYTFTTVTPETHRRVNARSGVPEARSLREVFGWSRPFRRGVLSPGMQSLLEQAGALADCGDGTLRSRVRFSTLGSGLYVHSAWPTSQKDAVFFGPDTYRFCALLQRVPGTFRRVVDLGCGSGAGGLSVARRSDEVVLADLNPEALVFSRVNARLNGAQGVQVAHSDLLQGVSGAFDLIVANPPYLADTDGRTYRDGGGTHGTELSVRIVREGVERLSQGGTLVLYTGAPVVEGEDLLRTALERQWRSAPLTDVSYEELDPDVFGEELEKPPYAGVERIALVALTARRAYGK
ncbi:class I SAM-dependent methyltransferase [Corallococcus praedator]|uniref:Class I SAM-dependent methyltransferase n=1 Tax=Corallococcus praedator TaxID=2316724 RepID=A0ABX9QG00_9BACT|nr:MULTISPECIES: class I SAM-dependent methyltransferase [Corallococcus]RKH27241.1 class I SAM-dependent methyltransferase [Corallococcus sp. CA031C]RKI06882.1 class I SAM-dependent methyltransferase [Corallococcus praedator]